MAQLLEQRARQLQDFSADSLALAADLVYPETCVICLAELTMDCRDGIWLCGDCRSKLGTEDQDMCLRCGASIGPYIETSQGCLKCRRRHFRFDQVVRLGLYQNELRRQVIAGKGNGARLLSLTLADCLWSCQQARFAAVKADVVVGVPTFWMKRAYAPHHQAETIAERLAERLQLPFVRGAIRKVRYTVDQSSLPREFRTTNLKKAFRVARPSKVAGKIVLLVDDVMTTGTTVSECAQALKKAGAREVIVAVLAVVD